MSKEYRVEHKLIEVKFMSWLPAEQRLEMTRRGMPLDASVKQVYGARFWVPWPVSAKTGEYAPEFMKPEDQGVEWAIAAIKRTPPDGMEILAIMGFQDLGVTASGIMNTPGAGNTDDTADAAGTSNEPAPVAPVRRMHAKPTKIIKP